MNFIDEMKLIKLVRQKESLWNFELKPEKRKRTIRNFAWSDIEREFDCKLVFFINSLSMLQPNVIFR
jgi:hypothetical protein